MATQEGQCLFDIAACRCVDFDNCSCPRESKVPSLERKFLLDQRSERKMVIGSLDKAETSKLAKRSERSSKRRKYYDSVTRNENDAGPSSANRSETESEVEGSDQNSYHDDSDSDDKYKSESESESSRNMMQFPTVARECDRYNVSDTAGAAIATATLIDYGIIKKQERSSIIDRCKLRRQRQLLRARLSEEAKTSLLEVSPKSIFFDGRKDKDYLYVIS